MCKYQTTPPYLWLYDYAVYSRILYNFFSDFFYFSFFASCLLRCVLILHSFYPLFCPTIARMSFCVQLVTRGNFKRLERKYEGFVYYVRILYLFCA